MLETELFSFLENTAEAGFAVIDCPEVSFRSKPPARLFQHLEASGRQELTVTSMQSWLRCPLVLVFQTPVQTVHCRLPLRVR